MKNKKTFQGLYTALITPFNALGELDIEGFKHLIERQIKANVDGIVVLGTTGESPTLTDKEGEILLSLAREQTKGRIALIAGVGTNSTQSSIQRAKQAEQIGADALMVVNPYYNKPSQEGLYRHFFAISEASSLPIMLYNHPGRTGVNIELGTFKRLMEVETIVAMKEASGQIDQFNAYCAAARKTEFVLLTGCDSQVLPAMSLGAQGVVSVVSNIIPNKMKRFMDLMLKGHFVEAGELHFELMPIFLAAQAEVNPISIKSMMQKIGLPAGECRLPLISMSKNAYTLTVDDFF